MMAADRPYDKFYDFYSVSLETFGSTHVLLLEERETLLPSKSPGSAASSSGTARLVEYYNF